MHYSRTHSPSAGLAFGRAFPALPRPLLLDGIADLFVNLLLARPDFDDGIDFLSKSPRLHDSYALRAHGRDLLFLNFFLCFEINTDYQNEITSDFLVKIEDDVPFRGKTSSLNCDVEFEACFRAKDHHFEVNLGASLFGTGSGNCCWHDLNLL